MMTIDYSNQGVVWYAMKTTYKKEMQAKAYLNERGIECFVPMKQSTAIRAKKKIVILEPAIYNLIFIKVDLAQLTDIKISLNYLHNRLTKIEDKLVPIVVPTRQMDQFIRAVNELLDKIIYVDLATSSLEKGTPVRITDGEFKGYEGELEKIKGKRQRRVSINVKGIVAYKVDVDASFIEKI